MRETVGQLFSKRSPGSFVVASLFLCIVTVPSANAASIRVFTDRTQWQNELSTLIQTETFDTETDVLLPNTTHQLGLVTFSYFNFSSVPGSERPRVHDGQFLGLETLTDGPQIERFDFPGPMIAWGADFEDATDEASLFITTRFTSGQSYWLELDEVIPSGNGFVGLISDSPFSAIDFDEEREFEMLENFQMDNLSFAAYITEVTIDIKPGSNANPVNPRSKGKLKVAILTTGDFDASAIDVSTVKFGPSLAEPVWYRIDDVDQDEDWDLVLKFNSKETGIACGQIEATLMGKTFDGNEITGTDSIKTVGCKKK